MVSDEGGTVMSSAPQFPAMQPDTAALDHVCALKH
jgi:hypothetical protein